MDDGLSFEDGITQAKNRVIDYLGSLIDSGNLEDSEIRLVESIMSDLENTLDSDTF